MLGLLTFWDFVSVGIMACRDSVSVGIMKFGILDLGFWAVRILEVGIFGESHADQTLDAGHFSELRWVVHLPFIILGFRDNILLGGLITFIYILYFI